MKSVAGTFSRWVKVSSYSQFIISRGNTIVELVSKTAAKVVPFSHLCETCQPAQESSADPLLPRQLGWLDHLTESVTLAAIVYTEKAGRGSMRLHSL